MNLDGYVIVTVYLPYSIYIVYLWLIMDIRIGLFIISMDHILLV